MTSEKKCFYVMLNSSGVNALLLGPGKGLVIGYVLLTTLG